MARKDLLSEAIADAKAVKATALANAKLALEEAFTPKLQSMISARLAEEADEDEIEEEEVVEMDMDMDSEEEVEMDMDSEDELDLESIIKELESELDEGDDEDEDEDEEEDEDEDEEEDEDEDEDDDSKDESVKADLKEAYRTIKSLQKTINEVNLLNAKLLYTNKLFRTFDLNENQKVKVLENFDRTSSVREVKLVFSTIAENLNVSKKKKTVVKEGYASKATKSSAPKRIISEGNEMAARWKKLAGLVK